MHAPFQRFDVFRRPCADPRNRRTQRYHDSPEERDCNSYSAAAIEREHLRPEAEWRTEIWMRSLDVYSGLLDQMLRVYYTALFLNPERALVR
jgi:hypothetical protein